MGGWPQESHSEYVAELEDDVVQRGPSAQRQQFGAPCPATCLVFPHGGGTSSRWRQWHRGGMPSGSPDAPHGCLTCCSREQAKTDRTEWASGCTAACPLRHTVFAHGHDWAGSRVVCPMGRITCLPPAPLPPPGAWTTRRLQHCDSPALHGLHSPQSVLAKGPAG